MAKPTNVVDRYNLNPGVREDLTDFITNVSPKETPLSTMFGRATAKQTYHEYQRDAYRAPNAANAAIDGDDADRSVRTMPERVGNYTQIIEDAYGVSGTGEAVDLAGRRSEMAYEGAKCAIELKRDLEARIVSNLVAVAGATGTPRQMAALAPHFHTNANHGAGGSTPVHTSGAQTVAPTAGTLRPLTSALVTAVAQSCYVNSGSAPKLFVMSPAHKVAFGGITGISAQRTETRQKPVTIIAATDAILTDFGEIKLVPHYMMVGSNTILGINPESNKLAYLRPWKKWKLAKTGDSESEQLLCEVTLQVKSHRDQGKIADLTLTGL